MAPAPPARWKRAGGGRGPDGLSFLSARGAGPRSGPAARPGPKAPGVAGPGTVHPRCGQSLVGLRGVFLMKQDRRSGGGGAWVPGEHCALGPPAASVGFSLLLRPPTPRQLRSASSTTPTASPAAQSAPSGPESRPQDPAASGHLGLHFPAFGSVPGSQDTASRFSPSRPERCPQVTMKSRTSQ